MKDQRQKLIDLYQEMYELTNPECGKCNAPHSCCHQLYCDEAAKFAEEWGVEITPTDHLHLPFMGEGGCIVPPHLRPICTLHTCDINSLGFKKPKDDNWKKWTDRYFVLRDQINEIEGEIKRL